MNAGALNELARVVCEAQAAGRRTPMGIAMAVESAVVEPLRARIAELEQGPALPMPMGPQMPDFPPPPASEVEKLHAERARLQELLADAVADAHRARHERDAMRERVSEPYGCAHCGIGKRGHGRRWTAGVGMHAWSAPSQVQIAERMRVRRTVRVAAGSERLRAQLADLDLLKARSTALERRVEELLSERHTTNEALSDAAEALRAQQDRIAELEQREASVAAFVAERAGYITAIRNCHPDNGHDYDRWQGHAAARRQLSELLGLPVAWPPEDSASVEKSTAKLKQVLAPSEGEFHDVLHHSYNTPHDLPEPGGA